MLKRSAQHESNQRERIRSSSTKGYGANGHNAIPDEKIEPTTKEFSKANRISTDIQQDGTEPWMCMGKPPLPKPYADVIAEQDNNQTEDKLTNGKLRESGPSQYSRDNSNRLSKYKPSDTSENDSRTRYASSSNLHDESRKKPLGTRILGSAKLNGGEFFRKVNIKIQN